MQRLEIPVCVCYDDLIVSDIGSGGGAGLPIAANTTDYCSISFPIASSLKNIRSC